MCGKKNPQVHLDNDYLKKSCWLVILHLDPVHDCWSWGIGPSTKTRLSYNLWPKSHHRNRTSSFSQIFEYDWISGWSSQIVTAIYHRSQIIYLRITRIEPTKKHHHFFVNLFTKVRIKSRETKTKLNFCKNQKLIIARKILLKID